MTETPPNPTPENPLTPPAGDPPAKPPEGYVPQDQVNSLLATERKTAAEKAREEALTEHFGDLGITDPAEIRKLVEKQVQADKESQSKAEQLEGDLNKERDASTKLKNERDTARSEAQKLSLRSGARLQALALGVQPDYVDGFLDAARSDLSPIKVGDEKSGFEVKADEVKTALSATLERLPIFATTEPTPPERIGMGPGPGDPPTQNNDWASMPDAEFEAAIEKAKQGGFVPFR